MTAQATQTAVKTAPLELVTDEADSPKKHTGPVPYNQLSRQEVIDYYLHTMPDLAMKRGTIWSTDVTWLPEKAMQAPDIETLSTQAIPVYKRSLRSHWEIADWCLAGREKFGDGGLGVMATLTQYSRQWVLDRARTAFMFPPATRFYDADAPRITTYVTAAKHAESRPEAVYYLAVAIRNGFTATDLANWIKGKELIVKQELLTLEIPHTLDSQLLSLRNLLERQVDEIVQAVAVMRQDLRPDDIAKIKLTVKSERPKHTQEI